MTRPTDPDDTRPRRGRRRLRIGAVALAGVTATALGVTVWQDGTAKPGTTATDSARVGTATVTRTDLSNAQTLSGTLGYGKAAPVKGAKPGLVTWLPAPGARVSRGHPLYKVDNVPVPVFYGGTPLYRTLDARGTTGPDVRMIADNLKKLGYGIGSQPAVGSRVTQHPAATKSTGASEPSGKAGDSAAPSASPTPTPTVSATSVEVKEGDGVLTTGLVAAIGRWQTHVGMPATGVLGIGDVVVQSGKVRVAEVQAQIGDDANGSLMTVGSTTKKVSVPVDATQVGTVARGDRVTVTLPDDTTVHGTVDVVGTAATDSSESGGGTGAPAQLTVTVSVRDTGAVRKLTSASVQVAFTSETRRGVLAVPVGALLALSEGGYAVQLPGGRLIAVRTGMFAKGLVEVSGTGVAAGLKVVTTS
ncbi:hypothetical protein [Streptomyces sp. NPDC088350]|uniref:hypothetical protein n=1 Tax=Streptomyces sp. NPDC088350 TaxID=3365854 RepID=UPI0038262B5F